MGRFITPTPEQWRDPRPYWDYFNAPGRDGYNPHYSQIGDQSGHDGVDFSSRFRTRSVAIAAGEVIWAGASIFNGSAGRWVEVLHRWPDRTWEISRSLHHDEVIVSKGDTVEQGEQIGYVGHTGLANYDHVHLGIVRLDRGYTEGRDGMWHIRRGAVWLDPIAEGILEGEPVPAPDPITVAITRPPLLSYGPPYGPADDNVRDYQALLARRGFLPWAQNSNGGVFDGLAGPSTRTAVESFQRSKGLPVTGLLDAATLAALGSYP